MITSFYWPQSHVATGYIQLILYIPWCQTKYRLSLFHQQIFIYAFQLFSFHHMCQSPHQPCPPKFCVFLIPRIYNKFYLHFAKVVNLLSQDLIEAEGIRAQLYRMPHAKYAENRTPRIRVWTINKSGNSINKSRKHEGTSIWEYCVKLPVIKMKKPKLN